MYIIIIGEKKKKTTSCGWLLAGAEKGWLLCMYIATERQVFAAMYNNKSTCDDAGIVFYL